ncbi:MAG: lytic transglycosylase domain-containing protein [Proteobacteria bacterium]|nr:lytic transglycosylase domain-containing protein [Pseudomonadota bacterium]
MLRIVCLSLLLVAQATQAAPVDLNAARSAYARGDAARLADLRAQAQAEQHPLQAWFDYWAFSARLEDATADEVDAYLARWRGTFFEDRLRNDWLLVLGRRGDWAGVAREYPRFVMNDDREVSCWAALAEAELNQGQRLRAAALAAWQAQRESDTGCQQWARNGLAAGRLAPAEVWRKLRDATEAGQRASARTTAELLGESTGQAVAALWAGPERWLERASPNTPAPLLALALARRAADEPEDAAAWLRRHWDTALDTSNPEARGWRAWAWAQVARQGAQRLAPQSLAWTQQAWQAQDAKGVAALAWSPDTLAWLARTALRLGGDARWPLLLRTVQAMDEASQADPAWRYWRARALATQGGKAAQDESRALLVALAREPHFYGQLAAEDLGGVQPLPPTPAPLTAAERRAAQSHPGLTRALNAIELGYRGEGNREWNFSLIGMDERALLAAADLACSRAVWDRCINTSERTRTEIDLAQRFPMPHKDAVLRHALNAEVEPALVYGLIRQESRFVTAARSGAGASGLMQVMPSTARWVARRLGVAHKPGELNEHDTNLRLGTHYLHTMLDDFDGSQALATAAYNAGPGRPRRWRDGPVLETAIWIENIPFGETRDYVKKVLSNASYYGGVLTGKPQPLKPRLGRDVGPATP